MRIKNKEIKNQEVLLEFQKDLLGYETHVKLMKNPKKGGLPYVVNIVKINKTSKALSGVTYPINQNQFDAYVQMHLNMSDENWIAEKIAEANAVHFSCPNDVNIDKFYNNVIKQLMKQGKSL